MEIMSTKQEIEYCHRKAREMKRGGWWGMVKYWEERARLLESIFNPEGTNEYESKSL